MSGRSESAADPLGSRVAERMLNARIMVGQSDDRMYR